MKTITCISDTHNLHHQLTKDLSSGGDIIIHAGDVSNVGKESEIISFLNWYGALPYKHKIFIAGNHDWYFEDRMDFVLPQRFIDMGIIYLMDSMVEIDGLKIYGSPWQPEFCDWAFNVPRGEAIAQKWKKIPEGLDILVTHGPAYGILDELENGLRAGCEELYKRIWEVKPRVVIGGHLHYGYGFKEIDGCQFYNAASLDDRYTYKHKPIVFEI